MSTTQQHLLISDIKDDILVLKNGGGALVLQVSAVNFGLLSDREQIAIISSFAQMLNSLSFPIQIVIRSERLNISSYLTLLDKGQKAQTNLLLSKLIANYRQFIQNTIKENEVLDKKFYLVVPLFALELGLTASKENLQQKIKTVLFPRRDQMIRQLNRVGLKATQMTNQQLIELFYDIYNGQLEENIKPQIQKDSLDVNLNQPNIQATTKSAAVATTPTSQPSPSTGQPTTQPSPQPSSPSPAPRNHPFVVEELE